ncbi:MAG: cupin domain-containing protein [Chitinophagaceae bacterium]
MISHSRREMLSRILLSMAGTSLLPLDSLANHSPHVSTGDSKDPLPFYVPPTSPLQPGPGGLDIRVLVRSSQTNMQFSCVEFAMAPKKMGPAPHYHRKLDELTYVLEGTVSVLLNDTLHEVPAGGWFLRPRNIEHSFFNGSDKPFRALDMYFNQNFEDYLEELFHSILPDMRKHHLTPNDPGIARRMHDLHERFDMVGYPEKRQAVIDKYGLVA